MNQSRIVDFVMAGITVLVIAAVFHGTGCTNGGIDYGRIINSLTNAAPSIITPTTTTTTSTTTATVVKPPFVPDYSGNYTAQMNMQDTPSFSFSYWATPDSKTVQCEVPKSAVFTYADGTTAPAQMGGGWFWARKLPFDGPITLTITGVNVVKTYTVTDKTKDQSIKAQ